MLINHSENLKFSQKIIDWYHEYGRKNLPWQVNNPYYVWVSEIMLQQTQVVKVIGYFEKFINKFPTLMQLAEADEQEVLALWSGLGYYNRAKNLHKSAQICVDKYNNVLPKEIDQLMALPGIGKTTAGAVLSLASNLSYPIMDGNVKRFYSRCFAISDKSYTNFEKKLWIKAHQLVPLLDARYYNQALMDIGATICKRSKPDCHLCPAVQNCVAHKDQMIDRFPQKKNKVTKKLLRYYVLLLKDGNKIYLEQRDNKGIWPQLWFLPLFESRQELIGNYKHERNKPSIDFKVQHLLTHRILELNVIVLSKNKLKSVENLKTDKAEFISLSQYQNYPHPTALTKIVRQYEKYLSH